jgi:hypothetical protein
MDEQRKTMTVKFIDRGYETACPPNPLFPDGKDVDVSRGAVSCKVDLPYPAPRCGYMSITCLLCGVRIAITVAGRRDDPRTLRVPCGRPVALQ